MACGELPEPDHQIEHRIKGLSLTGDMLLGEKIRKKSPENRLFYCVIYLAPGDYHRFHAPANFHVSRSNHFDGELFSVNSQFMRFLPSVLAVNERVGLVGSWRHGFFGYAPVAATGVGNIHLANGLGRIEKNLCSQRGWSRKDVSVSFAKGAEVGTFSLGSTVVLVVEAPPKFSWKVSEAHSIRTGEALGSVKE